MQLKNNANTDTDDPLQSIWETIWARRPILGDIMHKHGSKTLYDYTKDFFDVNPSPRLDTRKEVLITVVRDLLAQRLDTEVAEGVARQLRKLALVSTADHHGFIMSPFFVNSNLVTGLRYHELNDSDLRYLIAFSFATVSLNNSSYPRSLLFYGTTLDPNSVIKLPLLPDKVKMGAVYRMRSFRSEDIQNALKLLSEKEHEGVLQSEKAAGIRTLLNEVFQAPDILNAVDFSEQITKVNFKLWPKLFHPQKRAIPDLIYLDIESIVTELLLKHHLPEATSLISRFLFTPEYQQLIHKFFNNIPGAFSMEKDWGTYLFWALDDKNHRVRLLLQNGQIVSRDGNYTFAMTAAAIAEALRKKQIFPSMALCYVIVAFYYGMKCLGGFCQVSDLTRTKEAWSNFLQEIGEGEEAAALEPVQTKELGGDGMVLAYMTNEKGDLIPANAVDMILQPEVTSWERYPALARALSFREIMNPLVVEIYKVLFPEEERTPAYMELHTDQIFTQTGLKQKILEAL